MLEEFNLQQSMGLQRSGHNGQLTHTQNAVFENWHLLKWSFLHVGESAGTCLVLSG